ncbi:MAG: hypothetical protein ABIR30_11230 [Chitinophagaceae bacterium]
MKKNLLIIISVILMQHKLTAQSKWGFENYHYLDIPGSSAIVPMIHFETPKQLYAELRYNYESEKTATLLVGKTFDGGKKLLYNITPMTGFSTGQFTGISIAARADLEWKDWYFSAETQQSIATGKKGESFFFNWSELGYSITDHFFAGAAMQYIWQDGTGSLEPGIVAGLSYKNFSFPCYIFNPAQKNSHIVLGMNYEWSFKRRTRS